MMIKPVRNTALRLPGEKGRVPAFSDLVPAEPVADTATLGSIDISAAVRRRPFVAVAPFLVVLLLGVPWALRHAEPEFRAEATVYVSPTYFKNVQNDREQFPVPYGTLVNQQVLTISRYDVLGEALKRLEGMGINWRTPSEPEAAAVARLASKLEIRPVPDSYEVLVGLTGKDRKSLATIVNTIVATYLEKQHGEQVSDRASHFTMLTAARARIEEELKAKLEEQSRIASQLKVANLDKAPPIDDTLLTATRQAREAARRKRMEAEAEIAVMESSGPETGKTALTALAEESIANDTGLHASTNYLVQRKYELMARIEGLTAEHPLRQSVEKEIASINDQLIRLPHGLLQDASARLKSKLRAEVARTRRLEAELDQDVQTGTAHVQGIAKEVQQAQGLSAEIERLRKSQAIISSAIDLATQDSPSGVRVFSAARAPIGSGKSSSEKQLLIVVALAALLSIVLCVAVDLIDQRVHSPADVKRAVGFTPVGLLLTEDPDTDEFAAEHFWRLINGIQRGIAAQEAKCVVLTPVRCARNEPTLVSDIARALSSCGLKTVMIDANARRTNSTQLAPLAESDQAFPLSIEEFDLASTPPGEKSASRGLLRAPVVGRAMIEKLKREYDVVLIDAPAMLLSADIEFLAMICDITLMVAEAGEATRQELTQGANLLRRVGARSTGVILSQVQLKYAGRDLRQDFKRFSDRDAYQASPVGA